MDTATAKKYQTYFVLNSKAYFVLNIKAYSFHFILVSEIFFLILFYFHKIILNNLNLFVVTVYEKIYVFSSMYIH